MKRRLRTPSGTRKNWAKPPTAAVMSPGAIEGMIADKEAWLAIKEKESAERQRLLEKFEDITGVKDGQWN